MNLASEPQEVLHIGSAHNRSAMPFTASPASVTAPRVITNQYNNPVGLYSSENISTFNSALEARTATSGEEANSRPLEHSQPPGGLVIDKESEVYKMLQEKQELNEPRSSPHHSGSCRKSWSPRRKGIPTNPLDSEVLKLLSPKWLHQSEMLLRSCPCVTNVALAL